MDWEVDITVKNKTIIGLKFALKSKEEGRDFVKNKTIIGLKLISSINSSVCPKLKIRL